MGSTESNIEWLLRDLAHAPEAGVASVPGVAFTSAGPLLHPPAPLLATGAVLSERFEIVELLGRGGMGEVYRARDRRLDREVAIKILTDTDVDRRDRFEHEARAASAIHHEHVHAIHDVGTHDGAPFLVLELVEGRSLRSHLADGKLAGSRVLAYGKQIAEGLAAAHAAGVIHRDLKPENLVITRDDRVKIVDFGLAKLTRKSLGSEGSLTIEGALLGTVAYMSPEQARGEALDARSDLFALGAILVELFTGLPAFGGASNAETLSAILRDDPRGLAKLPPAIARVLERCLAKQPGARFQSANDLAFALAQLDARLLQATPRSTARPGRAIVRAGIVVGGLGVLVLGVVGVRTLVSRSAQPAADPAYTRLTFRRGLLNAARYAPDQRGVVYSGAWESDAAKVFATQSGVFESRPLGLDGELLAVSPSGELALKTTITLRSVWGFWSIGRLARAPLNGGTPRDVAEDISEADIGDDGTIAAVHVVGAKWRLEWPLGKVVYESTGWIGQPRLSPDGTHVAFIDHPRPEDDQGAVKRIDADGSVHEVNRTLYLSIQGLAWAPDGETILYTAARVGATRELRAVGRNGDGDRLVDRAPVTLRVLDVARDGRVLLSRDDNRVHMTALDPDGSERELSWLDGSSPTSFSGDDKLISFSESWDGAGTAYGVYVRPFDGGPAVRVADGTNNALSEKEPTEILVAEEPTVVGGKRRLWRQPIGSGPRRLIDIGDADPHWMRWFPDDASLLLVLSDGELVRVASTGGPLEHYGVRVSDIFDVAISPDGKRIAAMVDGKVALIDAATHDVQPVAGVEADERPILLGPAPDTLTLYRPSGLPGRWTTLDLVTGARSVRDIAPRDRAGVSALVSLVVSHDGKQAVYCYLRSLSTAYEVTGLAW